MPKKVSIINYILNILFLYFEMLSKHKTVSVLNI